MRTTSAAMVAALFSILCGAVLTPAGAQQRPRPAVADSAAARDSVPADSAARRAPPSDPRADSIIAALRRLQGFTATEYMGDSATYRAGEGVLRLRGNAEVARQGDRLTADSIVFRDQVDLVEAYGRPTVTGQAQELTGDVLFYDLARRRATALGARTKVTQSATWIVTGDVTLEGTEAVYASHGQFTTCDLEIPHYHFESDRIKVVRDKYLVARPARLYFGKVPVMVLPFVVQNLERGRRSGLVVPKFSLNDVVRTNSNYTREISDLGWYWAINDYIGAQLTGTWRSESYTALQASTDFRWRRQFLDGRASFQRYWRETGERELSLSANTSWEPDERTDLQLSANYASSSEFVRQATYDPRESTQDLRSTFGLSRRFDWGQLGFSADRSQSIADGRVNMTLPRLTISPQAITLFRAPTAEQERWYSNSTLQWNFNGLRTVTTQGEFNPTRPVQDREETRIDAGITQLSVGNLNLSATANLNQTLLLALRGNDVNGVPVVDLPEEREDKGQWQASIGYQQRLVGQTTVSPNIGLSQQFLRRDTLGGEFVTAPTRVNAGASMSTALFGFFPGVGPYTAIRHRLSPSIGYSYSPQVVQTELQDAVFGRINSNAQNIVSLTLSQTFEAKLKPREVREQTAERLPTAQDSVAVDSAALGSNAEGARPAPADAQKVTILSINTSPLNYDFVRAAELGNGFTTDRLSNTITSDYLKGLTIQMEHELFDRSDLDPSDRENEGRLGRFAPRLSQLSTGFELGPNTAVVTLLNRLLSGTDEDVENEAVQGVFPGNAPASGSVNPTGAATNNPQGVGAGPWNLGVRYSFTRTPRLFTPQGVTPFRSDEAVQTMSLDARFALTPNWGVSWTTDYSITDGEFGTHNLRFTRDLHRWQANFNFYKTPTGNSAFEFYVELIDNRDLKLDYRERNLGIDRERR